MQLSEVVLSNKVVIDGRPARRISVGSGVTSVTVNGQFVHVTPCNGCPFLIPIATLVTCELLEDRQEYDAGIEEAKREAQARDDKAAKLKADAEAKREAEALRVEAAKRKEAREKEARDSVVTGPEGGSAGSGGAEEAEVVEDTAGPKKTTRASAKKVRSRQK